MATTKKKTTTTKTKTTAVKTVKATQVVVEYYARKAKYTLGHLTIGGEYVCDVLTRKYNDPFVRGCSALPVGKYTIELLHSPRFSVKDFYKSVHPKGYVPRVMGFSGSSNLLFHVGNLPSETEGCFLVGWNTSVGMVNNSKVAYKKLMSLLMAAEGTIRLTVK